MHALAHVHTHTLAHSHIHTHTHSFSHTRTCAHIHAHMLTCMHLLAHLHTHMYSHMLTGTLTLSCRCAHVHSRTITCALVCVHMRVQVLTLMHSCVLLHTHMHTCTHAHTHTCPTPTHPPVPSWGVAPSMCSARPAAPMVSEKPPEHQVLRLRVTGQVAAISNHVIGRQLPTSPTPGAHPRMSTASPEPRPGPAHRRPPLNVTEGTELREGLL